MRRRETILAIIVGSTILSVGGVLGFRSLILKPLWSLDAQTAALRTRLSDLKGEQHTYFNNQDFFKSIAPRTFGRDPDAASAWIGKMLTDQIIRLGLPEQVFTRTPLGARRLALKGAQEIGWSVQGEGPLSKMIDLLFVLEQTPQVHRVDNLVVSAGDRPGRVKLRFRYTSLVLDGAPEAAKPELKPKFELASDGRKWYELIVQRDLLRPYLKRRLPRAEIVAAPTPPEPAGVRPEQLKLVSLSEWEGVAEAHVCDLSTLKVTRLVPGDNFGGGQVVMIDYRSLPLPGKDELKSFSRLILKIGASYWAIEEGQTLADKYQPGPAALPPGLPKL